MAQHGSDTIGRVFGLQRTAIRESRIAVWDGLLFQRRADDAVLAGFRAEAATREAAVELCVDTVRDVADRLDGALGDTGSTDESGRVRGLVESPLGALVSASETADETVIGVAAAGLDRYERGLRAVLLALNRRISTLLDKHEALEARLREYVEALDDDERAEQVTEFRRQLSDLRGDLQTMRTQIGAYDTETGD